MTGSIASSGPSRLRTLAALSGNVLEWYDFAIFGSLSDVISKVFFSPQQGEGHAALIQTFAVFGLAFLARPVGGTLIGWFGDKYGRKAALELSIFLMAIPTFLMGCLPSYESIGCWAIVLLMITRVLQGASVGGQLMTSAVFQLESQPNKARWGETGAWVMATANLGSLLGGVVSEVLRDAFTEEQLVEYGWRIPFLSGIIVAGAGIYLKMYEEESISEDKADQIENMAPRATKNPVREALTTYRFQTLVIALVTGGWACAFYVGFIWMPIYMNDLINPPVPHAFAVASVSMFLGVFVFFGAAGSLSDIYGRRVVMLSGALGISVYCPIHLYITSTYYNMYLSTVSNTVFGILLSLLGAPANAFFVESVPPAARLTTLALGYNIAQPIAGGMAPAFATITFDAGGPVMPAIVVVVFGMLSFVGVWLSPMSELDQAFWRTLKGNRVEEGKNLLIEGVELSSSSN